MGPKTIQFDMFVNEKETQQVKENEEFKTAVKKSIRGLFARYNDLEFELLELHKRLDRLSEVEFEKTP